MGVSRSHVCDLLDRGELAYRHVGTHRRIRAQDALEYIERQRSVRRDALDEISDLGHEGGLYPDDF